MFHVFFSAKNELTQKQAAVVAKHRPTIKMEESSIFLNFVTENFSLSDANEIVEAFDHIHVWKGHKAVSARYRGGQWCPGIYDRPMVPGFDNSPQYNVESVELCLL